MSSTASPPFPWRLRPLPRPCRARRPTSRPTRQSQPSKAHRDQRQTGRGEQQQIDDKDQVLKSIFLYTGLPPPLTAGELLPSRPPQRDTTMPLPLLRHQRQEDHPTTPRPRGRRWPSRTRRSWKSTVSHEKNHKFSICFNTFPFSGRVA